MNGVAPFLTYDKDPYIVVSNDGRLFWMMDAYTESSYFPYSSHHEVAGNRLNYIRNSVKVVIDAYNGTARFYVFDDKDPIIAAYRRIFPSLFQDANQMPADLRAHVRYPETLSALRPKSTAFITRKIRRYFSNARTFGALPNISRSTEGREAKSTHRSLFRVDAVPGEQLKNEFVLILPFTPAKRNNMIGWMAGRSDGENYGKLLVYNFPKSE